MQNGGTRRACELDSQHPRLQHRPPECPTNLFAGSMQGESCRGEFRRGELAVTYNIIHMLVFITVSPTSRCVLQVSRFAVKRHTMQKTFVSYKHDYGFNVDVRQN